MPSAKSADIFGSKRRRANYEINIAVTPGTEDLSLRAIYPFSSPWLGNGDDDGGPEFAAGQWCLRADAYVVKLQTPGWWDHCSKNVSGVTAGDSISSADYMCRHCT